MVLVGMLNSIVLVQNVLVAGTLAGELVAVVAMVVSKGIRCPPPRAYG